MIAKTLSVEAGNVSENCPYMTLDSLIDSHQFCCRMNSGERVTCRSRKA